MELPVALLPDQWGVAVVAGTGSCVWARSVVGRTTRAGGWGPVLGDEGSGYSLAVGALRLIGRQADRRERSSSLTERLLKKMDLTEPDHLVQAVHGGDWDRTRLSMLAEDVIRAADEGDPAASTLVDAGAEDLAGCVVTAVRALAIPAVGFPLALTGGLLVHAPTYRDRLLRALESCGLRPGHVIAVSEPAEGALRRATQTTPK